jgi:hypothetical protein
MSSLLLALLLACGGPDDAPPDPPATPDTPDTPRPASCDAGDDVWVERVFLWMLGRRPHGAEELALWRGVAQAHGRAAVVRALSHADERQAHWRDFLQDALGVARIGDRADYACFGDPLLPAPTPALAEWLATARSGDAYPGGPFTMTDVLDAALLADDLSGPWRLHLFARMHLPQRGANVGPRALEAQARKNFGDSFTHNWLHRDLTCMSCHNSQIAVTDRPDPAEDRHWPIEARFEEALFGQSGGIEEEIAFQVFRVQGVVLKADEGAAYPFGLDPACGGFVPRDAVATSDYLGDAGYFLTDLGERGSVWDVEDALADGIDRIVAGGLQTTDQTIDGAEAFAWLTAQNLVERVWESAMGERLTVANYFPRNQAQRDKLLALTQSFVAGRFSLVDLQVAIATDELFNLAPPAACDAEPYGLLALINPWSWNEADEARKGNSAGDAVHRQPARTLLRAAHAALDWDPPSRFPREGGPEQAIAAAIGAYQRESEPGFKGTNTQGILAWADYIGACKEAGDAGDGCAATPTIAGCAGCVCEASVCETDPYCCDVQWDETCVALCEATPTGCGASVDASDPGDTVDQLLARAVAEGRTAGDVVAALRDALLLRPDVADAERASLEALLGVPLTAPATRDLEPALRLICGATLVGPAWMLSLDAGPTSAPPFQVPRADDCTNARAWLSAEGLTLVCEESP